MVKKIKLLVYFILMWLSGTTATAQCFNMSLYKMMLPIAKNINPKVLELAINAYSTATKKGLDAKHVLTIVDYSLPSTEKRMWVLNLDEGRLVHYSFVTHGSGSGLLYARHFSNIPGTFQSSLGLFLTKQSYYGQVGYALRLQGLEPGINDKVEERGIVVHGAEYAEKSFIDQYGRLGRSEGCFALPASSYNTIINYIANGTLIFAYYPEKQWLTHSHFL